MPECTRNAISIEALHYAYPPLTPQGESLRVLRGIDFGVEPGEFLSIMGPTGVGKSTLCMALNGLVPQSTGGVISGHVYVLGHDARSVPVAQLAAHVGIVYQDPESQLFATTVLDEVAFGPENLGVDPHEIAERVEWALGVVEMRAYAERAPAHLSGGQKQRVAIAASLAMLPEVLILDEPTTNLDPVGQLEVFEVIERLCRQRRMTIVMVSHDAEHVAQFSDRVAIMWQGRIARSDSPERIFADADLVREVGIAAPQVSHLAHTLCHELEGRHFVSIDGAERALRETMAAGTEARARSAPVPSPQEREATQDVAVEIRGLVYHYRNGGDQRAIEALDGVDLLIPERAYLGVIGQNGSGKTTLVKHLNGLLKPTSGAVWVYGVDTRAARVSELARIVGLAFQNPDHQIFCATTEEEISFGPRNLGLTPSHVRERTEEALSLFGLTEHAHTPPALLGFGLRRLVSIAAVYAMRPRIFILDEPTAGLDRRSAAALMALIDDLHAQGHTIILVSHDMALVAEHTRQTLVMHEGRMLAYGLTRDVFARAADLATAQIRLPQITRLGLRLGDLGFPGDLLSVDEFVGAYRQLVGEDGDPSLEAAG
ncbi:MAG: ATP-binding cassette domain-containing protein [Anaerolineae bacterium]|nr:ATP-binding cassette domain-containing protein [Anaerolineae bacterium]